LQYVKFMCGIIAYIGDRNSVPILLGGLHKLEYRGYDSAGICTIDNNELKTVKSRGKIADLASNGEVLRGKGFIGIAHTRWATHGAPSELNAHPHVDCKNEIAIVHNGIIENYHALKEILVKEGHKIKSDTDSEIIAHLIEKFYKNNLEDAVHEALRLVEGTFGLAIIHKNEKKLIGARRGSPLVIGIGNNEMFLASDVSALLNHTKKVVYLNDDEIAVLNEIGYSIRHLDGSEVNNSEVHDIKWNISQIEKSGFKHFMLKEIFEQPESIENTLRGRIKDEKIKISLDINISQIKRIIILGCGTSWHSGLIGKYIIESLSAIPVEVDYASEFRYRNPLVSKNDLVIVISQSGETADTLAALREAKSKNAPTIGIINTVGSTIARECGSGVYLHAGPEIGVASTKAFTSQIIALLLVALYIQEKQGTKLDKKLLSEIRQLPDKVTNIIRRSEEIRRVANNFKNSKNFLYLGRGINFPVALEGALKLKEVSYIHAEGYPAAEMKHGPIALIDKNMPAFFIAPKDATYEKILSNMAEIRARKGKIIALVNEEDPRLKKLADYVFSVPQTLEELSPIINVVALQLFAYHIADLKRLDVDKPRNLAKSVTVE
jgi:glutamine---fructose-6-phosphate transaminase (isomerizing)